jgi:FtsZ-interacting cell division protein ZipA
MKKTLIIILAIIIVAILVWYWWSSSSSAPQQQETSPTVQNPAPNDTTSAINKELEGIDLGDLDREFQNIDSDLNSL